MLTNRPFVNRRLIGWRVQSNMCLNSDTGCIAAPQRYPRNALLIVESGRKLRALAFCGNLDGHRSIGS